MSEIIKINIEIPVSGNWTCTGHKELIEKTINEAAKAIVEIQNNEDKVNE